MVLGLKNTNTRKEKEDDSNDPKNGDVPHFYYEVRNHYQLFELGKSFFEDYQKGVKSFAIGSLGYKTSQQRAILGLTSFFDQQKGLKVGIVSDNLYKGVFKEVIDHSQLVPEFIPDTSLKIDIHKFYHHFDLMDMNDILLLGEENPSYFNQVLEKFISKRDVVFFDVPDPNRIKEKFNIYHPIMAKFESLSIVVVKNETNTKQLQNIIRFFDGHGINLKGVLLDPKPDGDN